jgi:hypothetical protein
MSKLKECPACKKITCEEVGQVDLGVEVIHEYQCQECNHFGSFLRKKESEKYAVTIKMEEELKTFINSGKPQTIEMAFYVGAQVGSELVVDKLQK